MNLSTFLNALPAIGPVVAAIPQVAALLQEAVHAFDSPTDQATAQEAIADLAADNDAGHARLQAKLAAAAKT